MKVFVMGDIHGAYKALRQCLQKAKFDHHKDKLIVLGDIADRQPEVYECVEELMKIPNLVAIRGNHDDWLDEFCQTGRHPADWTYGGEATIASYLKRKIAHKTEITPGNIPEKHQLFFAQMRTYYIDEYGRCFVHAGFNPSIPFPNQPPSTYYWDRMLWAAALEWETRKRSHPKQPPFKTRPSFKEIYLGHTSTIKWELTIPMQAAHVHNLDTGAGNWGKLTIMNVATKEFWQSDSVGELYP